MKLLSDANISKWPLRLLVILLALITIPAARTEEPIRAFITDSNSWQISGGFGGVGDIAVGSQSGGARPQTAEILKTFRERCPQVTPTINRDKADYIVILEHEGGKSFVLRDNKVAIFNGMGDMIYAGSTRSLGNAVKDACTAIAKNNQP